MELKLNLGCGLAKEKGFVNIDIRPEVEPDEVRDIGLEGLSHGSNMADVIVAKDFLEHIPASRVIFVIEEIWRVLKPGGTFESLTPDAEMGQGAFQDPTHVSFWVQNTWLYYSVSEPRKQIGTKANFSIERMARINTDFNTRVWHLHVIATAIKEVQHESD